MYRRSFHARSETEEKTPRAITSRSILANQSSTWFSHEEYLFGLVSRKIVEDDMDLLARRAQRNDFLQKGYEVLTCVARGGLSVDTAGDGIQRRIQRERSMAVVFKAMAFYAARGKRQNRVEPIKA